MTTWDPQNPQPVIGFDMVFYHLQNFLEFSNKFFFFQGGTSTDVSRYDGNYVHIYDSEMAGVSIQAPQLDITSVAAGEEFSWKLFFHHH